jgi:major vault protein
MNDRFEVRTKDNAVLELDVFYKWRLLINDDTIIRIFQSHDFIGYACQSMQSRIREVIARLDFEVFHSSSVKLLREELFRTKDVPGFGSLYGRYYPETAMLVSDVDVKSMRPTDPEIASLLNESIRANMKIVCQKLEDAAQIQAEKERIENQCEIEALRSDVIAGANVNLRKETLEKAKIDGEALLERVCGGLHSVFMSCLASSSKIRVNVVVILCGFSLFRLVVPGLRKKSCNELRWNLKSER